MIILVWDTSILPVSLGITTYFCFSLIEATLTNIGKNMAWITKELWHKHTKNKQNKTMKNLRDELYISVLR